MPPPIPTDFAGFDDYIEVFQAGTHTDRFGRTQAWTTEHLDQIVRNHATSQAPIVIGHPDHNAPAFGWTVDLKRQGKTLLAKFDQVEPQFAELVKQGLFKNRSIRILPSEQGFRLGHVGFLGAAAPAVAGLKPIEFQAGGESFDFDSEWQVPSVLARMMRNMREFLIAQFGQDKADAVITNWDIDDLTRLADEQRQAERAEADAEASVSSLSPLPSPSLLGDFSMPDPIPHQSVSVADFAAVQQQVADFAAQNTVLQQQLAQECLLQRRSRYQLEVDKHLARGVKPADLAGVVDFMCQLPDGAEAAFEFSLESGVKQTTNPIEVVTRLLNALPAAIKPGRYEFSDAPAASDFAAGDGAEVDVEQVALLNQIYAYQKEHQCDFTAAVDAVVKRG